MMTAVLVQIVLLALLCISQCHSRSDSRLSLISHAYTARSRSPNRYSVNQPVTTLTLPGSGPTVSALFLTDNSSSAQHIRSSAVWSSEVSGATAYNEGYLFVAVGDGPGNARRIAKVNASSDEVLSHA